MNMILINTAMLIESYFFPVAFLYYACQQLQFFYLNHDKILLSLGKIGQGNYASHDLIFLSSALRIAPLMLLNVLVAWGLLIRKDLYRKPEKLSEIFIPLISTFFCLSYSILPGLPPKYGFLLISKNWLMLVSLSRYLFCAFGLTIAAIATYNLKHSFAVFIQVRQMVIKGLYRYVRHPIYLGYIVSALGLSLAYPRLYAVALTLVYIYLFIVRAVLEEKKMSAAYSQYREYMQNTPFIIPLRIRSSKGALSIVV